MAGADAGGLALNVVSLKTPLLRVFERDFSNVEPDTAATRQRLADRPQHPGGGWRHFLEKRRRGLGGGQFQAPGRSSGGGDRRGQHDTDQYPARHELVGR